MASITISETQFAFTFFYHYYSLYESLIEDYIFPTLIQEGDPNFEFAGADLVVNRNILFQFKMGDYLTRRNTSEINARELDKTFLPYYRMWIKNSDSSNQFNLLKQAVAIRGFQAFYIAPLFIRADDTNYDDAFRNFRSASHSDAMDFVCSINCKQFVDRNINLTTDDSHKVCYNVLSVARDRTGFLFSEPKEIEVEKGLSLLSDDSSNDLREGYPMLDTFIKLVELFKIDAEFANTSSNTITLSDIRLLARELLIKHDIFWLPIMSNRRT